MPGSDAGDDDDDHWSAYVIKIQLTQPLTSGAEMSSAASCDRVTKRPDSPRARRRPARSLAQVTTVGISTYVQ